LWFYFPTIVVIKYFFRLHLNKLRIPANVSKCNLFTLSAHFELLDIQKSRAKLYIPYLSTTIKKRRAVMASLNKVQLIGRLGRDPETTVTPKGNKVTNFSIAVGRRWRNSDGKVHEDTDWFRVVAWKHLATICQEYLSKGRLVYIEGRLQTDRYEVDGETKYSTKVVARSMQMLDAKPEERQLPAEEEGDE